AAVVCQGQPPARKTRADVVDLRVAPAVDRLFGVADHGHVSESVGRRQPDEIELDAVGVLELVHDQIAKALTTAAAELGHRPERSRSSRSSTVRALNESGSNGAAAPLRSLAISSCSNSRCPVSSRTRSSRGAPTRYANSSSKRAQMLWKVPIHAPSRASLAWVPCTRPGIRSGRRADSSLVMRTLNSSAARSLKATVRIWSGATPCSTSQQTRSVATNVLPLPGPAALSD